ncbi:CPBP family intramembrane glutamic endopeptidase [Massilibacterium senegalense]|uniref:CPBP family intramembrane glutamic endopeptidase n=1 Tax=Massilibacterium senegalense TaxID=1632858 RepID=UPI0038993004
MLLDIPYIFKGKTHLYPFFISSMIAILEELLFRYYLFTALDFPHLPLLIISSIFFGILHLFFSVYDVFSKTMLSLVCGIIFLVYGSVLYPILFHVIYNFFALKKK